MTDATDIGAGLPVSRRLETTYAGRRWRIFKLAFWTSVLTVLTAGFYRFWAKSRLRRYYWSAIRPGGWPMEYVGEPLEKLLGFLIAVSFLAFYIGVVNLVLMFFSYAFLHDNFVAYLTSFLGVIPLWFYARYRARRYILARTRWRGIRFGMEPGAWGYAWRAVVHWTVTIISLGLLWPRMTFWLEKYRTDRTFFGTMRVHQGGRWTLLYPAMTHLILPVLVATGIFSAVFYMSETVAATGTNPLEEPTQISMWSILGIDPAFAKAVGAAVLTIPWFIFGIANFRAVTFRVLTENKSLGDVGFQANPRRWRIFWILVLGNFATYVLLFIPLATLGFVLQLTEMGMYLESRLAVGLATVVTALIYFLVFTLWGALTHTFVTLPLTRHFAQSVTLLRPEALNDIHQRARDEAEQAEGFAEALDVGAAI